LCSERKEAELACSIFDMKKRWNHLEIKKNRETYEIMKAQDVGMSDNKLVMGKHSGRHAFVDKLKGLGYDELSDDEVNKAFEKFKELADKKKDVTERDLIALISDEVKQVEPIYKLEKLHVEAGNDIKPQAKMIVINKGKELKADTVGNGPVDAIFRAVDEIVKKDALGIELLDYIVHAVTEGTDALGEVTVRVKKEGRIFTGHGANTDVLVASAEAYLNAINKFLVITSK